MIHNTDSIEINLGRSYQQSIDMKPSGLWYSFNNEWEKFCKNIEPNWIGTFNYKLEVDYSNILVIQNKEDLLIFIQLFSKKMYGMDIIDWYQVSQLYSGIEFKNYFKYKREAKWLYGYDMDSGCIWNLDIVKKCYLIK